MPVTITYDGSTPTVGGDEDTWGTELNANQVAIKVDLDALAAQANSAETDLGAAEDAIAALEAAVATLDHTGAILFGLWTSAPAGWVKMNGGTIGSATSGASIRANDDTQALFQHIWTYIDATDAPIFTSAGAPTTRGATGAADFAANKRLTVPDARGMFLRGYDDGAGVDASRRLGSYQADDNKAHTHTIPVRDNADGGVWIEDAGATGSPVSVNTGSSGGAEARPKNIAALAVIRL